MDYFSLPPSYEAMLHDQLARFFDDASRRARTIHPRYELLWQEMARFVLNGGKRIRPRILLLAYTAFGGNDIEAVLPAAAAQEILHASLLMHDDIMDQEQTRRGDLNLSGRYEKYHYHHVTDEHKRRHYSDSAALLGGDLLLVSALQLLAECSLSPKQLAIAQDILSRTVFETAGGQLLDSEMTILPTEAIPAELVARYKTASYSFISPLLTGAALAGADDDSSRLLEQYGEYLGIAYQLNDDILGVFGDESQTGKSTLSDLREGKRTFLVESFMRQVTSADRARFDRLFGNPHLTKTEAADLKNLIEKSGARTTTKQLVTTYAERSTAILTKLPLSDTARTKFQSLIRFATQQRQT